MKRPQWWPRRSVSMTADAPLSAAGHGQAPISPSMRAVSDRLTITSHLWNTLLGELQLRGGGKRESGAFLLSRREASDTAAPKNIVAIAYYDDLDAHCLTGGITMSGTAYDALWTVCREQELRVVADVHTHPSSWVLQSPVDRANPMMAHAGHLALIIGNYASASPPVGMYRYLGEGQWQVLDRDTHLDLLPLPDQSTRRRGFWNWKPWWQRLTISKGRLRDR